MRNRNQDPHARIVVFTICLLVLPANDAHAQWQATYQPTLEISRVQGEITIDGIIDDEGWQTAAVATHFAEHQPGDQVQPPFRTVVYVTYDDTNFYVAYDCFDDNPGQIRASFCRRDQVGQDDNVIIAIDTFGDATRGYEIGVNPYGIQADYLYSSGGGEDVGYDLIFTTGARITDTGWQAEFAIPFSSLRFPATPEQTWKVDFWRNHPRDVRTQASWAAYDRSESCWPCQWGTVTGIRDVDPAGGLDLIPAFTANQSGARTDDGDFDNGKIKGELSLTAKYAITSDLSAEATLNPDFSQVESDAVQIDVNSNFALFYPEKRPFFQEGSDLFDTWIETVYTRSINDPSVAGKVLGRSGGTQYGVLAAYDQHSPIILPFEEGSLIVSNGKSVNVIGRARYDLGDASHVGLVATDRRYDGGGNGSLVSLDSRLRLSRDYSVEMQYAHSFTTEPDDSTLTAAVNGMTFDDGRLTAAFDGEEFTGHGLHAAVNRDGRTWDASLSYRDRSPTFRAENGFEGRNNYRNGVAATNWIFHFDQHAVLDYLSPGGSVERSWNYDGVRKDETARAWFTGRFLVAQASFHAQYTADAERFRGTDYRGLDLWHMCANARPSDLIIIGGYINHGRRIFYRGEVIGRQTDYGVWFDLKPIDRLLLETNIGWSRSKHVETDETYFDDYVMRSKLSLQITRELSVRVIVQYDGFRDSWEGDPLLQYQINPFSIFYVGSTRDYGKVAPASGDQDEWRLAHRQYFLKLQYLFGV